MSWSEKNLQNRFLSAIRRGNLNDVTELISSQGLSHCRGESEGFGFSLVCCAAKYDRTEIVKLLLSHDCCINSKTPNISSPLHLAMKEGNAVLIKYLLCEGALINAQDPKGLSPLHLAVTYGREAIVKLLLAQNADPNVKNLSGANALHTAAQSGSKAMCEMLLKSGADLNVSDEEGMTPLHISANRPSCEVAQLFLEKNANVNVRSEEGFTPVYIASKCGNKSMCELLVNFAADINICDEEGKSAVYVAVEKGHFDAAEFLLEEGADLNKQTNIGISPIYASAMEGREDLFMLLTKYGAQIDVEMFMKEKVKSLPNGMTESEYEEKYGKIPRRTKSILHQAVYQGCPQIIEFILKNCKVDVKNDLLKDLLGIAVEQRGPDAGRIVNFLTDFGFYLSDRDMFNNFELISVLVERGYLEVLENALERGLDVNMPVKTNYFFCSCTLLHIAVNCKHSKIAEMLLLHGAKINIKDCSKYSPLNYAVRNICHCPRSSNFFCYTVPFQKEQFDLELAEMLLYTGASTDSKNREGISPFQEVVKEKNLEAVDLLLEYDADVFCEYKRYYSTLYLSLTEPHYEIMKLLFETGFDISAVDKEGKMYNLIKDFLDINEPDRLPKDCETLLKQHIIKLKAANSLSNARFLDLPVDTEDMGNLRERCDAELSAMKEDKICDWSFYDMLKCTWTKLTVLLRKENFRADIQAYNWRDKYPIYEAVIFQKLLKANRRRKLLIEYEAILSSIFSSLPSLCVCKIADYFSNQELRHLIFLSKVKLHSSYYDKRHYSFDRTL